SIALIAGALLIVAAGCVAMGWSWIVEYARVLGAHASAERFAVIQYTPAAVLYGFGVPKATASAVAVIIALLAVAAAVGGVIRASSLVRRFCIACCAIPFVAGFFHEHDFVALFASALFAVAYARRAWAATLGCALVGINWLDFAQQPQAVAQDAVLACGLLCALIALRPQRGQFVAAGVALLSIAAGAWIGAVHHLPIWPNDMHGVAAGASIAEVWKNEQLQTGLMRPDAAAALLRTFALLGSALLLWSTLDVDVHHVVERGDRVGLEVL
ncbi:MAG TPA: hypothetical protein VFN49_10660, partial [Candidatus Aquilonibacter sp.]|nr:hypothetical protein [Candidatus Aquilonibacter sp.]